MIIRSFHLAIRELDSHLCSEYFLRVRYRNPLNCNDWIGKKLLNRQWNNFGDVEMPALYATYVEVHFAVPLDLIFHIIILDSSFFSLSLSLPSFFCVCLFILMRSSHHQWIVKAANCRVHSFLSYELPCPPSTNKNELTNGNSITIDRKIVTEFSK